MTKRARTRLDFTIRKEIIRFVKEKTGRKPKGYAVFTTRTVLYKRKGCMVTITLGGLEAKIVDVPPYIFMLPSIIHIPYEDPQLFDKIIEIVKDPKFPESFKVKRGTEFTKGINTTAKNMANLWYYPILVWLWIMFSIFNISYMWALYTLPVQWFIVLVPIKECYIKYYRYKYRIRRGKV